jgi:ubiquinone/menaquinone biosynthesis C-methylase UbiE
VEKSSEVRIEKIFSEETHWERAAKTRMGKYLTRMETDFIFKSIKPLQTFTIMDVGAEAGRFSLLTSNSEATIIGIDIESYGLKRLKRKAKDINVIQADARKIPIKEGVFDAIFMIEVLDYIAELGEVLTESHRTLKSNASLFLSFGNKSSLKSKLRDLRGKSYRHSYNRIMRCLSKIGFVVVRKMGYNWLLFGRTSENRLIPFSAGIEKLFGLRRIPSLSPWVMLHAVKGDKSLSDNR